VKNELTDRRGFIKTGLAAAIAAPALGKLQDRVRGKVVVPGDADYDRSRAAWNVAVEQHPKVLVLAEHEADIVAAVNFASRATGSWGLPFKLPGFPPPSTPYRAIM